MGLKPEDILKLKETLDQIPKESADDWNDIGKTLLNNMPEDREKFPALVGAVVKPLVEDMPRGEAGRLAKDIAGASITEPDAKTRNVLWLVAICAISVVVLVTAVFLATGLLTESDTVTRTETITLTEPETGDTNETITTTTRAPIAKAELVLSVLTLAVGFLSGIFVPTPGTKKDSS